VTAPPPSTHIHTSEQRKRTPPLGEDAFGDEGGPFLVVAGFRSGHVQPGQSASGRSPGLQLRTVLSTETEQIMKKKKKKKKKLYAHAVDGL
jgi:hypothetical protein